MSGMLRRYYRGVKSPSSPTLVPLLLAVVLLAVGAMPVASEGIWHGEYFNNRNLAGGPYFVRNDEAINFDWGKDSPGGGVGDDDFSVRWTGSPWFDEGEYRFMVTSDDGARLWVDGHLIIDVWYDHPVASHTAQRHMSAGYHSIRMEYYEAYGEAVAKLWWERISAPPSYPDWHGEYFSNIWLSGPPAITRNDASINFNWGYGSPGAGVGPDYFSARWIKNEYFATSQTYNFTATTDDGIRVWVDGTLLIDAWFDQSQTTYTRSLYLSAGYHEIRVEYYEKTGVAVAKLSYPGAGTIPGVEVIVDDLDPNFIWGGPTSSWYRRAVGYRGQMAWTWNGTYTMYNWGKWIPSLPSPGNYEVYAYIPSRYAGTSKARYRVFHNGERHDKIISQTIYYNEWVSLGTYYFNASGTEYVFLGDNTGEAYASRFVGYDAMKFVSSDGVVPPVPTPVPPPTPTPSAPCSIMPQLGFGQLWNNNATVRTKLGCPTEAEKGVWAAEQVFIGGFMIWRADTGHIYAIYNNGAWQGFVDTWTAGEPESDPSIIPPAGYYQPLRGFGKVWRTNASAITNLSWATTQERGLYASVQAFSGGTMVWSNVLGIFVLYNDGTWARY